MNNNDNFYVPNIALVIAKLSYTQPMPCILLNAHIVLSLIVLWALTLSAAAVIFLFILNSF